MLFRALIFGILLGIASMLPAQIIDPDKVRFGRVSSEELSMVEYEPDPEAEAVVLFNQAMVKVDIDRVRNSWEVVTDRHIRIKFLKASGLDRANFSIPLESARHSTDKEELRDLQGSTFVLRDGKEEEIRLDKEGHFVEEVSETLRYYKISMPAVQVGAVIDLKYTIKSDFIWNLPTWWFQEDIPVHYSELEMLIPEYFIYNVEFRGYSSHTLTLNEHEQSSRQMVLNQNRTATNRVTTVVTDNYHWIAQQVPAFRPEAYAPATRNFLFRAEFELASVNFPGQSPRNFSTTWEDLSAQLRESPNFGGRLNDGNRLAEEATAMTQGADTPREKVMALYESLKRQVRWNENYGVFAANSAKRVLSEGTGNSAELNFTLLNLARAAGLEAYPVMASTRRHGYLSLARPAISQFNHLIAAIRLSEEEWILLDATRPDVPMPLLPEASLNERGRIIGETFSDWINIQANGARKRVMQLSLKLNEDFSLSGSGLMRHEEYAALDWRRQLRGAGSQADFWRTWASDYPTFSFSEFTMEGEDDIYQPINSSFQLTSGDAVMDGGELLYLSPILFWRWDQNPFQSETREYPVDLVHPLDLTYIMQLELPEGTNVAELPESGNYSLPDGAARYSFSVRPNGNNLMVMSKLTIPNPVFVGQEAYGALREFFNLIVADESKQIVLRKPS